MKPGILCYTLAYELHGTEYICKVAPIFRDDKCEFIIKQIRCGEGVLVGESFTEISEIISKKLNLKQTTLIIGCTHG